MRSYVPTDSLLHHLTLTLFLIAETSISISSTHNATKNVAATVTTNFPDEDDGVGKWPTEKYNVSWGSLTCTNMWPWLNRTPGGSCKIMWPDGVSLPQVHCEAVGAYNPVANSFSTLMYDRAVFQVSATEGEHGRWSGWCAYQKTFEMRKVKSLSEVAHLPFKTDDVLLQYITNGLRLGNSIEREVLRTMLSQGFLELLMEYGPSGIGANAAVMLNPNCPTCPAEVWNVGFIENSAALDMYLWRAVRISIELSSAYVSLATAFLGGLDNESLVEAVRVRGGERWKDPVIFQNELPRLRSLDLARNGITSLREENFQHVPNLHHLDLSFNQLHTTPRGLSSLQQLRTLNLSHNPIVQIGHNFAILLHSFPLLKELKISGLPLEKLDYLLADQENDNINEHFRAFKTHWYSRLEVLDVSGCNVSSVESRLWARAGGLRVLRLADNPLASVPPWLAQRLPALQELDLSGCLLAAPPALLLAPAQRLRRLLLARNLLATPRGALASGGGAGGGAAYLDVSGNPLRGEWGAGAFAPLGARASVNLSRTQLTALSPQMLRSLQPLSQVDLGGNAFDCSSCSILPLQEWISNRTTPEVVSLGRRAPLVCQLPVPVRGRPLLEVEGPSPGECAPAGGGWSVGAIGGAVLVATFLVTTACVLLAVRFRLHLIYMLHVVRVNRTLKARSSDRRAQFDFDAFVCYSKFDRSWVLDELVPQLEEDEHTPYRLCLHERNFPLGSLIVQNIVECMERSRHTLIVLTPSFVESQWCQWELEMATHRLLEGAGRDFLVLVELQRLEARALPRLLRLLVETRTFLQWPPAAAKGGVGPGTEEAAWKRLRAALGPPLTASRDASKKIHSDF